MRDQWWLASLGRTVVWARLRVREAGTAEVFDSDGNTLAYDSEDTARAMLMHAEFVSFDGLAHEDAPERGVTPDDPPRPTGSDDTPPPRMVDKLGPRTSRDDAPRNSPVVPQPLSHSPNPT